MNEASLSYQQSMQNLKRIQEDANRESMQLIERLFQKELEGARKNIKAGISYGCTHAAYYLDKEAHSYDHRATIKANEVIADRIKQALSKEGYVVTTEVFYDLKHQEGWTYDATRISISWEPIGDEKNG